MIRDDMIWYHHSSPFGGYLLVSFSCSWHQLWRREVGRLSTEN